MIDGCGREIDHPRLSVTDHCNLACRYCVPGEHLPSRPVIDAEFAFQFVDWLARKHGIRHVRLTGGEPLLHPELIPLVRRLSAIPRLDELTLTTNGQALAQQAAALRTAGLACLNVSLDALVPDRFAYVTRWRAAAQRDGGVGTEGTMRQRGMRARFGLCRLRSCALD